MKRFGNHVVMLHDGVTDSQFETKHEIVWQSIATFYQMSPLNSWNKKKLKTPSAQKQLRKIIN